MSATPHPLAAPPLPAALLPFAQPAPRIPDVPDAQLVPPELVAAIRARRGGGLLNLDRMLLHSPAFAVGWNAFLGAVRQRLGLDANVRELAICAVALLTHAPYEYSQHAPEFLAAGGTQAQLDALADLDAAVHDAALFNPAQRAALALAQAMTLRVQVSPACFAAVQAALPVAQHQVELVGVIAAYNMVARFLEALAVQPEPA
jgi:alkylhydroperoxidase family enzyme